MKNKLALLMVAGGCIAAMRASAQLTIGVADIDSFGRIPGDNMGFRLDLPIGPVRVDYGLPLKRDAASFDREFHFDFNIFDRSDERLVTPILEHGPENPLQHRLPILNEVA